ncbi:hypothetical protein F511_24635 [Dorcoceras hygrometricum]|uniref:Uncharacterized protein n=1 Tax=Dorcoceras hygrometricum TaxID=472368 RepID=A0A2Z7BIY8_9LAMI|nr:hypothetical protein F511_24635 [Dorcoceras hygrometricum]
MSTRPDIFALVEIREIKWATHFLPKIDLAAKGKGMLEVFDQTNPVEEHCQLVLKTAWEDVSNKMVDYDEWVQFCTARRSLVLYKLFEMEVQKRVDENRAKFKPAEPSINYDYMCIRFLCRELKEIVKQHRTLRSLAGANSAQPAQPKVLALEFSTQEEQKQAAARRSAQQAEQVEEIVRNVETVEEREAEVEHQAPAKEQIGYVDGQQVLEQPTPEEEDQRQKSPTHSGTSYGSSVHFSIHNEDSVDSLGPYPSSNSSPSLSKFQREENNRTAHEDREDST